MRSVTCFVCKKIRGVLWIYICFPNFGNDSAMILRFLIYFPSGNLSLVYKMAGRERPSSSTKYSKLVNSIAGMQPDTGDMESAVGRSSSRDSGAFESGGCIESRIRTGDTTGSPDCDDEGDISIFSSISTDNDEDYGQPLMRNSGNSQTPRLVIRRRRRYWICWGRRPDYI